MANSSLTIQILDNNLSTGFFKIEVLPIGNLDKWTTTTFVVGATANYYECEIGVDIEQTVINLKTQIEDYYIGAGYTGPFYTVSIIGTDTLNIEINEQYLRLDPSTTNLTGKALIVNNSPANLKYYIEYKDVVNIDHRFELYDFNYYSDPILIQGSVSIDYGSVDRPLEVVRGQGLKVDLEANQNLTFEDLYSEEERTFETRYYRNEVVLFRGWLNPEGFFEDYVSDRWKVSFDCVDGFSYLDNLAFVYPNGFQITGKKKQIETLAIALQRTGFNLEIYVDINIFYTGLADTLCVLDNVFINTKRYVKDDGITLSSCEDVLKDILEPYGACITSINDKWVIYKPNELFLDSERTFFIFDYEGVDTETTSTIEFSYEIGSNVNGFDVFHCNENQTLTNKRSVGAYRINYKFGLVASLIENNLLLTTDGISYDDFDIDRPSLVTLPSAGGFGAYLTIDTLGLITAFDPVMHSTGATVDIDSSFTTRIRLVYSPDDVLPIKCRYNWTINITDGVDIWYQLNNGTWQNGIGTGAGVYHSSFVHQGVEFTIEETVNPVPIAGDVYITLCQPYEFGGSVGSLLLYKEVSIIPVEGQSNISKGEFHTFQRTTKPSSKVESTVEVLTGDSDLDIYEGTIYKADGSTPTSTWFRKGITEALPIIGVMGEETLRMNPQTARVYNGDIFGFIPYISVVTIDGVTGKFMPIKYSNNTKQNIISLELRQIFGDELSDISYVITQDYGTTVKPTITG